MAEKDRKQRNKPLVVMVTVGERELSIKTQTSLSLPGGVYIASFKKKGRVDRFCGPAKQINFCSHFRLQGQ